MSRLADILMGMDRGATRPEGVGGIPGLAVPQARVPVWRRGVLLVIVVAMLSITLAVMLRPRSMAPTAVLARASTLVTSAPGKPAPPPASDQGVSALLGQGFEKAQQGALGEAAGLFKKALDLRPADVETWNNLGVVLVRQGQTARGVEAFSQALRLDPDHREAHRNLAVTFDRQGRSGEAAAHYQAFLRLAREDNPTRDDVRRRLAEISASGNRASVSEPE